MPQKRVAVAMSGGVDSSLAAALLKESGYDVRGLHMQLYSNHNTADLEQTCQLLDIPLYQINLQVEFQSLVVDPFCQEYERGYTPNPCIFCNQYVKFGLLLKKALEMGMDYLATGHYAQIEQSPTGYRLLKAVDPTKDQSYFLYTLGQSELQHLLLPVGNLRKVQVKRLSLKKRLPTATKRESQDICFIPNNEYRAFITKLIVLKSGDIVDIEGKVLGKHSGLALYTIGQRQGLGLNSNKRLYVLRLDTTDNRVVVGSKEQLFSSKLFAHKLSWVSGLPPRELTNLTVKVRYKSPEVTAKLYHNDGIAVINFPQPQWAITPGQAIVFYQDNNVLGGGIITNAETILQSGKDT